MVQFEISVRLRLSTEGRRAQGLKRCDSKKDGNIGSNVNIVNNDYCLSEEFRDKLIIFKI